MSLKRRKILILLALGLLALSVAALVYAWLPSQTISDIIPIKPTYFVPPAGVP